MARKGNKKKAGRRPGRPGGASLGPAPAPAPLAQAAVPPRVGGDQSLVRAVEMSLAPRAAQSRRGGRIVLENEDPAIPLDRVPYFTRDLTRLGIVAAVMVALLIGGAQLIPLVVK